MEAASNVKATSSAQVIDQTPKKLNNAFLISDAIASAFKALQEAFQFQTTLSRTYANETKSETDRLALAQRMQSIWPLVLGAGSVLFSVRASAIDVNGSPLLKFMSNKTFKETLQGISTISPHLSTAYSRFSEGSNTYKQAKVREDENNFKREDQAQSTTENELRRLVEQGQAAIQTSMR